ncbi:hypothetical protein [Alistipes finegoldii]|uniref:hypothetical protein n=1 Tax=Alistipes finegoldii TaxID=214856 RepID=UPI00267765E2|nr:hypothetical protein [Alistipes finegoldii]
MTALPSHLPVFSFFGGSLFFSGGLFFVPLLFPPLPASKLSFSSAVLFFFSGGLSRSVAVSSSSRQQTFFFFGGSLFPLRRPFLSRCRFSFLSCKLFLSSAVLFFVRQSFLSRNGFPRCSSG